MFAKLLTWMVLHVRSDSANEIEILVLRHQLAVLQRRTPRPRHTWSDRAVIAALAPTEPPPPARPPTPPPPQPRPPRPRPPGAPRAVPPPPPRLPPPRRRRGSLTPPATIQRWHRQLVRRRWTTPHTRPGRPRHPGRCPRTDPAPRYRESSLGLSPYPRRARRDRLPDRRLHRLEDPHRRRHRSRAAASRSDLDAV